MTRSGLSGVQYLIHEHIVNAESEFDHSWLNAFRNDFKFLPLTQILGDVQTVYSAEQMR